MAAIVSVNGKEYNVHPIAGGNEYLITLREDDNVRVAVLKQSGNKPGAYLVNWRDRDLDLEMAKTIARTAGIDVE